MSDNWIKPRHRFFRDLAYVCLAPVMRHRYGLELRPFTEQGGRQYVILYNHQTPMDQFFIGMAVKGPVYYVATEDIVSAGFVSSLIRYAVAPIPIRKGMIDISAMKTILCVAREGGTICIAPEGNRTYSGRTGYINPSVAKLCRKLKLPIALFRIEGGYGIEPRWADKPRKGRMTAGFSRIIEPEEYASITDAELADAIVSGLHVDEARDTGEYRSDHLAEYIERAMYVCPWCGLTQYRSSGDVTECTGCGRKIRYLPDKRLQGVGCDFPYRYIADWYDYQESYINGLNDELFTGEPLYTEHGELYRVVVFKKKEPVSRDAQFSLYGDRLVIEYDGDRMELPFDEVSGAVVLGRNRANIYHGDDLWQLRGSEPGFNALKYVNIYHRYKNIKENDPDGKFLGL